MSRQLLRGRGEGRRSLAAHAVPPAPAAPAAAASPVLPGSPAPGGGSVTTPYTEPPGDRRVLRRPAVLALIAAGAAGLAALAWVLLSAPGDPATGTGPLLPLPRASAAAAPSASVTPAGDAAPSVVVGRDPFAAGGAAPTGTVVAGGDAPAGITAAVPASPLHTETTAPATAPTGAPSVAPTGSPTARPTGGAGAGPTVTVTVMPTFLGFYGWNGPKAAFRVNAKAYTVGVGSAFGAGLRFAAVVHEGGEACAVVSHDSANTTVCPGQVERIR